MLRRLGACRDGGAGLAEYAGLIVLAALILGALVALGLPAKVETGVSSAICQIFQRDDCAKPKAGGNPPGNQTPGGQNPGTGPTKGGPTNGTQPPNGQQPNGNQPSLEDLQKNADNAQKAANDTNNKYGNLKQQIIDLLKDFIGITDIEECITKGSISSCLWAAFDVASWAFAALKIAKFAKAIKDAIKIWKEYNKGRKLIEKAKDGARRAKEALKKRRRQLGCPVAFSIPRGFSPRRAVYASVTQSASPYLTHAKLHSDNVDVRVTPVSTPDEGCPDLGPEWKPKAASEVCQKGGCEEVADKIHSIIGGKIMRITSKYPFLGKYRGVESGWQYHDVVIKDGKVFDATTGRYGETLAEYRAHWEDGGSHLVFNPAPR